MSLAVCLLAQAAIAQEKADGIVAIHFGNAPASERFAGTGFIISDGWVVTARHVVEPIANRFFITLATKNHTVRPLQIITGITCPRDGLDICLFKIDVASQLLERSDATPFRASCIYDETEQPFLETTGFITNNSGIYGPIPSRTLSKDGYFTLRGERYENLIRTTAGTGDGLSGSPVSIHNTRTVVGVHTGYEGNSQFVSPLYNLPQPFIWQGEEVSICDEITIPSSPQQDTVSNFCTRHLLVAQIDCEGLQQENTNLRGEDVVQLEQIWRALRSGHSAGVCERVPPNVTACLSYLDELLSDMEQEIGKASLIDLTEFLRDLAEVDAAFKFSRDTNVRSAALDQLALRFKQLKFDSDHFRPLFESATALDSFLISAGFDSFPLSASFLRTYPNYVSGRDAIRQGRLKDALDSLIRIDDAPDFLRGVVDPLIFSLRVQTRSISPNSIFDEFISVSSLSDQNDFVVAGIAGNSASFIFENFGSDIQDFEREYIAKKANDLFDIALRSPKIDALGAQVQTARFERARGEVDAATSRFNTAYEEIFSTAEIMESSILGAVSALHFIATDSELRADESALPRYLDQAEAVAYARPDFACVLWNHPDFHEFRDLYQQPFDDRVRRILENLGGKVECL